MKANKKLVLYAYLFAFFLLSRVFIYSETWSGFIISLITTSFISFILCFAIFFSKNNQKKLIGLAFPKK